MHFQVKRVYWNKKEFHHYGDRWKHSNFTELFGNVGVGWDNECVNQEKDHNDRYPTANFD